MPESQQQPSIIVSGTATSPNPTLLHLAEDVLINCKSHRYSAIRYLSAFANETDYGWVEDGFCFVDDPSNFRSASRMKTIPMAFGLLSLDDIK